MLLNRYYRSGKYLKVIAALAIIYIASYILNSISGGYVLMPSGNTTKMFGITTPIAAPDSAVWLPYTGVFQRYTKSDGSPSFRADIIGYFYSPVILVDQTWIHPSKMLLNKDGLPNGEGLDVSLRRHPRY